MKHGKILLSLLLTLALLMSMSTFALAEEVGGETAQTPAEDAVTEEAVVEEAAAKMTVRCVDTDGAAIRDQEADYLDLSKDQVLDEKTSRPAIEGYIYQKTMVGNDEIVKLSVSHDETGAVITATVRQSGVEAEKKLSGSETVLFVYEKAAEHVHSFDEGKVTTEPSCTEKGVKTFTCSCGETKTEEIPALGHDWNEPTYTCKDDNSQCTALRTCKRDASHTESETVKPAETVTKEATCTEKGEKTLKATFANEAFAEQSKTAEIPALGHDFAHGRCKRCDGIDPNFKPKLTDNTNGHASWGTDYKVTSDAARKDFQKLLIDGQEIASSNYSVAEVNGNTVVTVKGSAIKTLKVGQHSIAIVSQTGTAQRNFSVSDKPKTGDETAALWTGLLLLSALGCGAVTLTARKKFSAQ
jgi:hypothetical protein